MNAQASGSWISSEYWEMAPTLYGWVHSSGDPIYVERYDPPAGEVAAPGERLPVLLLEGLGYGSWMWFRLLPELASGRPVLVVDNRGVGGSERASPPHSIEQMADDAAAVLAALGVCRAHVVGVSMGGFIAQALAVRHPDRAASLTLVVTSAGGPDQEPPPAETIRAMTQVQGLTPEQALRQAMQAAATASWWEANQATVDRIVAWRLKRPVRPEVWRAQWQAIAAFDYTGHVGAIQVPVLVVAASEDRVMPPSNTRRLATLIPGARLVEVEGVGHWVFIERPEALLGRLRDHFAAAESRGGLADDKRTGQGGTGNVPAPEQVGTGPERPLRGKVALVTGAARGLGLACALALARKGADVAINDLPSEELAAREAARKVEALGVRAAVALGSVDDPKDVERVVRACEQQLGPVDILVNNAGINRDGLMKSASVEDWQAVLSVNLTGPFLCTRAVINGMRERGWGRIINIASVVGKAGIVGTPYYAASKAGLMGLTRATAAEVARRGITVNAVAPGYVETAMTDALRPEWRQTLLERIPVGRFAKPEEVAAVVAFLATPEAAYITGATIDVNGGLYM